MQPVKNLEKEKDDPRFDKVMGIFSGAGLASGFAELIQNGLHMNAGEWNAALSIDLKRIALATKSDEERKFAQEVYRNLAQMALNNQKSAGLNMNAARNAELSTFSDATAHPDTLPDAARFMIRQSYLNYLLHQKLYDDHTAIINGTHKSYSIDPNSATKVYDAKNSPSQLEIIKQFNDASDAERKHFLNPRNGGQ
jgi:hypothetical protein